MSIIRIQRPEKNAKKQMCLNTGAETINQIALPSMASIKFYRGKSEGPMKTVQREN
jgi:hypothetical protein